MTTAAPRSPPVPISRPSDPVNGPPSSMSGAATSAISSPASADAIGYNAPPTAARSPKIRPCSSAGTHSWKSVAEAALMAGTITTASEAPTSSGNRWGREAATTQPTAISPSPRAKVRTRSSATPRHPASTEPTTSARPSAAIGRPARDAPPIEVASATIATLKSASTPLTAAPVAINVRAGRPGPASHVRAGPHPRSAGPAAGRMSSSK